MIVLLSGKQGSGKSTLAKNLEAYWGLRGYAVYKAKFAQPLYEAHDAVYTVLERWGITAPEGGVDKPLLQVLGTEWGRAKDPDMWVKALRHRVSEDTKRWRDLNYNFAVLVDDLRFKNEFHAFDVALKIRLECDRDIRKSRAHCWRENENHSSETDLDDFVRDGKFDLVVDSGKLTSEQIVEQVAKFHFDKARSAFIDRERD
jgi:dephospho-CoA kinase